MAVKDYKARASTPQPPTKKGANSEHRLKKTAITFGVGFLSGLLVAGMFCITYLDNNHPTANIEHTKPASPGIETNKEPSDAPTQSVPSEDQSVNQPIDYQFYEALEKFELPEPVQGTPSDDELDTPLFQNQENKDFPDDKAPLKNSEQANQDKSPTRYILQAGTFTNAEHAQTQRHKIVDLGYKEAHIFQTTYDNKQYYRVWLGPYRELEQARTIGNTLKAARIEVVLRHDLRSFDPKE